MRAQKQTRRASVLVLGLVVAGAVVDDFRPNGGPATAPTTVDSGAYEEDAFAGNWSDTAYAICATA
ncbi:hypothetical protein [Micromonospora sp. WMMD710]|uniref:hypothetical protein n=1 Tax=Micromonospora sp. WMMD710 TaxID=3016085 RepID=UPI002415AC35|nr:hypothetical protein [Micromonospora sp. WMMD710]MDG4759845.1 hypothetical protein [Micromonospora sp. WMMD710]